MLRISLPLAALVVMVWASPGRAQAPLVAQQRLPEVGRSVASTDDSTALVLNPANLAFLPGAELRWTGTFLRDEAEVPWQGHAFALAVPLPFSLATGLRLDLVSPPPGANLGIGIAPGSDYQWLTFGLAARSGKSVSFGASLERAFAQGRFGDGLASYSLGGSFRFVDELGVSLVAQNVNQPSNVAGVLSASYTAALALRPLGTRSVELGLEGKYLDADDIWVPRATLGIDLPLVGRLRAEVQVSDPGDEARRAWIASAGIAFFLNQNDASLEAAGSIITGNGVGSDGAPDLQTAVASRGFPEPVGLSLGRYAVRVRVEDTPDAREHVQLLRGLWSLSREPRIDAVVLELRAEPAATLAHVQELRDALVELRRMNKRVLCHLEDADTGSLYLCAAANQIWINPAGGVRFAGMKARYAYFARLLANLGIRAEAVQIGEHKSAPERFTRSGSTDVSRQDKIDLLQQTERHVTEGLAGGRNMSFGRVRALAKIGPFMAQQAKDAGLVDGLAFDDEVDDALAKLLGRHAPLTYDNRRAPAPTRFAAQPGIAIVYVEGDMIDGRTRRVPLIGAQVSGSYTIADALRTARESPLIKAVVLRVETPGGSSTAADVIWRQVQLTAKVKPVIVSMGGYAASGGYYISAPGTRIFANPSTLTGSIGVYYAKADASQLLDRIGVDIEVYKSTEHADAEALYRPFTEEERLQLERSLRQFYDLFLERVASGRKLDKAAVDRVAQGRVWTGEQAREHGLVDELGGLRQALDHARRLASLPEYAPIIELPELPSTLLGRLLGVRGLNEGADASLAELLPVSVRASLTALAPFLMHSSDVPLMRLSYVPVEP